MVKKKGRSWPLALFFLVFLYFLFKAAKPYLTFLMWFILTCLQQHNSLKSMKNGIILHFQGHMTVIFKWFKYWKALTKCPCYVPPSFPPISVLPMNQAGYSKRHRFPWWKILRLLPSRWQRPVSLSMPNLHIGAKNGLYFTTQI